MKVHHTVFVKLSDLRDGEAHHLGVRLAASARRHVAARPLASGVDVQVAVPVDDYSQQSWTLHVRLSGAPEAVAAAQPALREAEGAVLGSRVAFRRAWTFTPIP